MAPTVEELFRQLERADGDIACLHQEHDELLSQGTDAAQRIQKLEKNVKDCDLQIDYLEHEIVGLQAQVRDAKRQLQDRCAVVAKADHEHLAALNVKVYADKSVSPQIPTVANASVDPRASPVLVSVGVTTACQSTTRWVEPFDLVAKVSKHVEVIAATADRANSHGIELASISVGPACELRDSAISAVVPTKDQLVDATIGLEHPVADSTIECRNSFAVVEQIGPDQATASDISVSTTGHSNWHSGSTGIATTSGLEFGTQASMSVCAEAAGHVGQSVSCQPEPLIIQSIAHTMAGTYMHMYMSMQPTHSSGQEQRHLRHMWVNPFVKMLNWTNESLSERAGLPRDASHGSMCTEFMNSEEHLST
ncbi:hypothetical protein IWW39_006206 [Coemansia spiralis]|uniref:Pleckstrin homology domain-containing protein n=1 Tax=Coemansia spiralis TaxID=417178 RepID=A0A9W8L1Q6_9FUNG|nr:hypothetical protein IWW39_006206 [Coemansia spiralis]